MKVIDAALKGNIVRLYLGRDDLEDWYGDDWNDTPYEHNAGRVYDEFVEATADIAFPYDWDVSEPSCNWNGDSGLCREQFKTGDIPLVVAAPKDPDVGWSDDNFKQAIGRKGGTSFRMGDRFVTDVSFPDGVLILREPACTKFSVVSDEEGV